MLPAFTPRPNPHRLPARLTTAASLVALLAGCALGPDFFAPAAPDTKGYTEDGIPKTKMADAKEKEQRFVLGKKITGDWWQLFHAPRLNAVLEQAIAGNQTLVAARASLAQSFEVVAQAKGILYPQLDFSVGATRQVESEALLDLPGRTPPFNIFTVGRP